MKEGYNMEELIYFDWYADESKKYAAEYSGIQDDLSVLETENYIVYLTVIGDTNIRFKDLHLNDYIDFPDSFKSHISKNGMENIDTEYQIKELCRFNYCISKKIGEDEEEFILCSKSFDVLSNEQTEKENMVKFLNDYLK